MDVLDVNKNKQMLENTLSERMKVTIKHIVVLVKLGLLPERDELSFPFQGVISTGSVAVRSSSSAPRASFIIM